MVALGPLGFFELGFQGSESLGLRCLQGLGLRVSAAVCVSVCVMYIYIYVITITVRIIIMIIIIIISSVLFSFCLSAFETLCNGVLWVFHRVMWGFGDFGLFGV